MDDIRERVILVGVDTEGGETAERSLDELAELAATAGAEVTGRLIQTRECVHPATYIGRGKLIELKELLWETEATGIICDDELSSTQLGNLEEELDCKVLDRTLLILDIFAARAVSGEGKIQVELAQLRYRASRLSGLGRSLSRLGGGIGTRGPGEKKLEMDRRLIRERISRLKKELATLRKVMIGYINQIDSLSRLTNHQKEVIADVTRKYNVASQQISNLSEEKKNLNKKVTLAAQLDATNINIQATNKRGKKAKKVKDVVKLKINFTIVKNITAETGERTLYVRITKPDNDVLSKNASNTFPYENRELAYSIKKYIEYNGEEQSVTVYWDVEEFLYAGSYRVDIFSDGTLIGSQSFNLD